MQEDYAKAKAKLLMILVLLVCSFAIGGFYAGQYHALSDMEVSYHAGIVTFVLDGHAYEHIAEGWVENR